MPARVAFAVAPLTAFLLFFAKAHAGNRYRLDDKSVLSEAYSRLLDHAPDAAVGLLEKSVRRDLASPYRWSDLGAGLQAQNKIAPARDCFAQAIRLGPNVPPNRLRAANFLMQTGDAPEAIAQLAATLKLTAAYDGIVFGYYRQLGLPVGQTLNAGIPNARSARTYFASLLVAGRIANDAQAPQLVWDWAFARGYVDTPTTVQYANYLFARHDPEQAAEIWKQHFGASANLIFNGGFETPPTGAVLDWAIQPSTQADAAREGQNAFAGGYSLRIRFHGDGGEEYAGVSQLVVVKPGRYVLRARIRSQGIATDAGVSLRAYDAENAGRLLKSTPAVSGSATWTTVEIPILVQAPTRYLNVQIVRAAGSSGDGVASGSAWIDAVELVPIA